MKAPVVDYIRVDDLSAAFDAFAAQQGEAVYLAGGHSLIPSLTLRLQAPSLLIDISRISELSGIAVEGDWLRIGAMTRHAELITHPLVAERAGLFAAAGPHVAHPAIRNRGTIGGNLSYADPASEFPAVAMALRCEIEVVGPDGARRIPADDFFLGLYETALEPGEILRSVYVPPVAQGQVAVFDELARRRGDYAMVGAAVSAVMKGRELDDISIVFFSVGLKPVRAVGAEAALVGAGLDVESIKAAQSALSGDLEPDDQPDLPASMRMHLARVLLGRLLGRLKGVGA